MLEMLKEALAECEQDRANIEACDYENEIKADVEAYEAQVRAKYETKKSEELLENSYQIKAINSLIEKEEKKQAEKATDIEPDMGEEVPAEENV